MAAEAAKPNVLFFFADDQRADTIAVFSSTLRDPAAPGRPQLFFAYKNVQRAVLQGNCKLIRYPFANWTQPST